MAFCGGGNDMCKVRDTNDNGLVREWERVY